MTKALRYIFLLLVVAASALGYWVLPQVKYETDVMALFPQDAQTPALSQANQLLAEGVTRKLFFLLSSSDWQATETALPEFAETLLECDCIAAVSARQDGDDFTKLRQHYLQYAPVLLSKKDKVLLQQDQGEAIATSALRDLMANPAGVSAQSLTQDPLATLDDFVSSLQTQTVGRGSVENGYLYFLDKQADRRYVLIMAELAGSPYAMSVQTAANEAIEAAVDDFVAAVPEADVVRTGALFYTRSGTEQARQEISTVGLGSVLGVLFIFLLVFRSPSLLLLALLPIAAGVLVGLTVTAALFGSVHIVALVFGASLVGVSIDYSLHFLCKRQAMGENWQPEVGLRKLMPGLSLGLLTSVAGYLGFAVAGFPGLRQVAVFSCAGLAAAYLVVVGFYPWVLRSPSKAPAPAYLRKLIPRYLKGARRHLRRITYPEVALPLALLAGIGLYHLNMQDDVRAMQTPDAQLQSQEKRFRELVGGITAMQYLLVEADSQESLLRKLEQLQEPLQALSAAGIVQDYVNLANWVPSQQTQQENYSLLRKHLIGEGILQDYLSTVGVKADARAELLQRYTDPSPQSLTLNNTAPLVQEVLKRPLYFEGNFSGDSTAERSYYSLILLQGLKKQQPLQALAEDHENVLWVDRVNATNQLLEKYRYSAMAVLAAAYLVILLLLMVRYRFRGALAVLAPPLLASVFTVSMLAALGIGLSVFNVMALLLVLGIGIDYTLFLRESGGRGYDTLFAIGLSAVTTVLSFGLLSLSATHAIFSFGLTVLLGIVASFLLAPLSLRAD